MLYCINADFCTPCHYFGQLCHVFCWFLYSLSIFLSVLYCAFFKICRLSNFVTLYSVPVVFILWQCCMFQWILYFADIFFHSLWMLYFSWLKPIANWLYSSVCIVLCHTEFWTFNVAHSVKFALCCTDFFFVVGRGVSLSVLYILSRLLHATLIYLPVLYCLSVPYYLTPL